MKQQPLIAILFILNFIILPAQEKVMADFSVAHWDVNAENHKFLEYKGKKALYLEKGSVILKDSKFKNGIIDYDVNIPKGRKFSGIHFRIREGRSYEEYYVRPHQSGNPDAMQYTPVFNGNSGWQLYHSREYQNAYNFNFDEWMHVRLVINNAKMDVFINDMSLPVLGDVNLKMDVVSGQIGFSSVNGGAFYANLQYQTIENAEISKSNRKEEPIIGSIQHWAVSEAFDIKPIKSITNLNGIPNLKNMTWQPASTEANGLINIARFSSPLGKTNTILLKTTIVSDKKQTKRLDFGYSDIARVFIDTKLVYSGSRIFRSRDYRYLGSIGYFDAVYVELKKGSNEVVFAVTENFGGWGLQAKLENLEGIVLKN